MSLQVWRYRPLGLEDPTHGMLILFATFTVACGSIFAAHRPSPERAGTGRNIAPSNLANNDQPTTPQQKLAKMNQALSRTLSFTPGTVVTFFVLASVALTVLFFTLQYTLLFWAMLLLYCLLSFSAASELFSVYVY